MTRKSARRKTSAKKELAQTFYEMRIYAEKNFGKTMTDTNDPKKNAMHHSMKWTPFLIAHKFIQGSQIQQDVSIILHQIFYKC